MDSEDSLSDVNIVSSDEPSSSAARDSGNSSSDVNVVTSAYVIFRGAPSSSEAKDSGDSSSDANNVVASSGEPSYSAAKDFGDGASNANNFVASTEPSSSAAKDSGDSSSEANNFVASSSEPSSSAAKDSSDTSSNANTVASSEPSSSAAKDSSDTSSNANTVASSDGPSSSTARGSSVSSGRSLSVASGYTCDELIFHALYTINSNHDGNGLDINGIYEYHRGKEGLPENFMDLLRDELPKLVIEGQVEKVGELYKIPAGAITPEASNPTESVDTEGSAMPQEDSPMVQELPKEDSAMAQELPSIPRDERQEKVDEALRLVAVAEDCENQVKEAVELANRSVEELQESIRDGLLAEEIARRCARGEKVFLR